MMRLNESVTAVMTPLGREDRSFIDDFLRVHGPCRGGEILAVGLERGATFVELCRRGGNARVVGLDDNSERVEVCAERARQAGLAHRLRVETGDAKMLPFANGRFEAVVSLDAIHELPDPAPVLSEMLRVVAPGGTVFVRDYAGTDGELTVEEIRTIVRELGLRDPVVSLTADQAWTWVAVRPG
ncbi:MAG: class I SAM-dependent methyltransferase [Isosphaeraceae bacterium]